MNRVTFLVFVGLLWGSPGEAQPALQRGRPTAPPIVEPCDLVGQPSACATCPALMAALRLPGAPTGDNGVGPDGIDWSPLYVAFRLDCRDAGRLLVARGANPERGGRAGALLAEVAAQRFASADPRSTTAQVAALEWTAILAKPRTFDLDTPVGEGLPSTRVTWLATRATGPLPTGAAVVWSRIESLSANFPTLVIGAERVAVDYPAPDTGLTRPSETAVSRGVEAMFATMDQGGMMGLSAQVQACWAEPRTAGYSQVKWRWHVDNCAAMDVAAADLDAAGAPRMGVPRTPFFLDDQVAARLTAFDAFRQDGLQPAAYVRALRRSVLTWMPIQFAIRSKN